MIISFIHFWGGAGGGPKGGGWRRREGEGGRGGGRGVRDACSSNVSATASDTSIAIPSATDHGRLKWHFNCHFNRQSSTLASGGTAAQSRRVALALKRRLKRLDNCRWHHPRQSPLQPAVEAGTA